MKIEKDKIKYIFLDVDGVLNYEDHYSKEIPIDEKCVEHLKEIVDASAAKLVLSSTWRKLDKSDIKRIYLDKILKSYGLELYDETPQMTDDGEYTTDRGQEIELYLEKHPCDSFIILDDSHKKIFERYGLQKQHILTYWDEGLTDIKVKQAIKILK